MSPNQLLSYNEGLRNRLEETGLPMDRYFTVKEWEILMRVREQLFTTLGQIKTHPPEQFRRIERMVRLEIQNQGEGRFEQLFQGILGIMGRLSATSWQNAMEGRRHFGFHSPTPQNGKTLDFNTGKLFTKPGRQP